MLLTFQKRKLKGHFREVDHISFFFNFIYYAHISFQYLIQNKITLLVEEEQHNSCRHTHREKQCRVSTSLPTFLSTVLTPLPFSPKPPPPSPTLLANLRLYALSLSLLVLLYFYVLLVFFFEISVSGFSCFG